MSNQRRSRSGNPEPTTLSRRETSSRSKYLRPNDKISFSNSPSVAFRTKLTASQLPLKGSLPPMRRMSFKMGIHS